MKIWFTGKILTGINIWLNIYWYITLVTTCGDMGIIAPEVYLILLPNNSVHVYTPADADQKVIWQRTSEGFIYSAHATLKQQSEDKNVGPLGNIILIPCQPIFAQK